MRRIALELSGKLSRLFPRLGAGQAKNLASTSGAIKAGVNTVQDANKIAVADIPDLTAAERDALLRYTRSTEYVAINRHLRYGDDIAPENTETIELVRSALRKLPDFHGVTYRKANLPPEILDQHQIGSTVIHQGFGSSSKLEKEARGPGNEMLIVVSATGKNIAPYSSYPREGEVLFDHGTPFFVIDRYEGLGPGSLPTNYIVMIEATDGYATVLPKPSNYRGPAGR